MTEIHLLDIILIHVLYLLDLLLIHVLYLLDMLLIHVLYLLHILIHVLYLPLLVQYKGTVYFSKGRRDLP